MFVFKLTVPVNNFSVMSGRSHHFLGITITSTFSRALTRILKIGVKMAPSRKSWSFTIYLYWDFSKSWSQIQKVG